MGSREWWAGREQGLVCHAQRLVALQLLRLRLDVVDERLELDDELDARLDEGRAGENVGVLLRGTKREDVERGQVLTVPGGVNPHTKFEAEVYVLGKDEGGRHTPFFTGYRQQYDVRTTDVTGTILQFTGDDGSVAEMVMPGDRIKMTAELINPIAIEQGMRFAIREGGRTVGAGVVSKILD